MEVEQFIDSFCKWSNSCIGLKYKTKALSTALRDIIKYELPEREGKSIFFIRDFTNSQNLNLALNEDDIWCFPDRSRNSLFVGTTAPLWVRGWSSILKDEDLYQVISDFFHFATQYIIRSRYINLIGSICLVYKRPCDFRGSKCDEMPLPLCNDDFVSFTEKAKFLTINLEGYCEGRRREILYYLKQINALDPLINKAIFYYVRAHDLLDKGFLEEAMTALDNVISSIIALVRERKDLKDVSRRQQQINNLIFIGLDKETLSKVEQLYLLRCRFASHPSLSKWWDFGELYDGDISEIFYTVKTILYKAFQFEQNNQLYEKEPVSWVEWFKQHCKSIYDAVWFHQLPT